MTFNNENVHRIKMLDLILYPLYSPWLLDIFHQRGKIIDSSPASKSSAPSETKGAIHSTKLQTGENKMAEQSAEHFTRFTPEYCL